MAADLMIRNDQVDAEGLHDLTRQICDALNEVEGVSAETRSEGEQAVGAKGEPITLGAIALAFITSGAAVAAFKVLETYFKRDKDLTITIKREDGSELSISSKNYSEEIVQKSLSLLGQEASGNPQV